MQLSAVKIPATSPGDWEGLIVGGATAFADAGYNNPAVDAVTVVTISGGIPSFATGPALPQAVAPGHPS